MPPKKDKTKVKKAGKPAAKAKVTLEHIFKIKQAHNVLSPTYTPGADRVIAHIKREDPNFPLKRDCAHALIQKIKNGQAAIDIYSNMGAGKGKRRTVRAQGTQKAVETDRPADPNSGANSQRTLGAAAQDLASKRQPHSKERSPYRWPATWGSKEKTRAAHPPTAIPSQSQTPSK